MHEDNAEGNSRRGSNASYPSCRREWAKSLLSSAASYCWSLTEESGNARERVVWRAWSVFELRHAESCPWCGRDVGVHRIFTAWCCQLNYFLPFALAALILKWALMVWKFSRTLQGVTMCCERLTPGWIWWILPQQRYTLKKKIPTLIIWLCTSSPCVCAGGTPRRAWEHVVLRWPVKDR